MPFLGDFITIEGGNNTVIPPTVIGEGPPTTGSAEDSGYFYLDSLTNKTYVNVNGTYVPVALTGETGTPGDPGQPKFTGEGPPGGIPDAGVGDLYLDTTTGSLYRLGGTTAPVED